MSTPVVLFVSLLLFMIIGVPVAWSLSLSCIAALLTMDGMPLVLLTQRVYRRQQLQFSGSPRLYHRR